MRDVLVARDSKAVARTSNVLKVVRVSGKRWPWAPGINAPKAEWRGVTRITAKIGL
jgi:hypothetical protein